MFFSKIGILTKKIFLGKMSSHVVLERSKIKYIFF
jgi:hypothetical protein